ncbi:PREDICTED: auxin-binding protein ABP19a-like isoform 2 [Fragaria vesca subsp. vesca]
MQDFCVADYAAPQSPAGYACKDPVKVTVDDFVFSGLRVADFAVGGVVPIHSHRDATELVILVEGTVVAGFIASNNKAYVKTLHKGDTMVFPQGLFHFLVNVGRTPALAYASFSSANPGVQTLETALFQNDLPTEIIAKSTLLDKVQIQKLKRLLGGS